MVFFNAFFIFFMNSVVLVRTYVYQLGNFLRHPHAPTCACAYAHTTPLHMCIRVHTRRHGATPRARTVVRAHTCTCALAQLHAQAAAITATAASPCAPGPPPWYQCLHAVRRRVEMLVAMEESSSVHAHMCTIRVCLCACDCVQMRRHIACCGQEDAMRHTAVALEQLTLVDDTIPP